jgi:hypothetical protein
MIDLRTVSDRDLWAELIRRWPGRRIRVPKQVRIPEVEILAAVLAEVDLGGQSQWRACVRVGRVLRLHHSTVWRIVQRRRCQPRCGASRVDPEHGHG